MANTKIINVAKNDSFEDVFNLVKSASAEEVILILPKGSKLAKQAAYFEALRDESRTAGKLVSVMTADPVAARLAVQAGIGLLGGGTRPARKVPMEVEAEIEPEPIDKQITELTEPDRFEIMSAVENEAETPEPPILTAVRPVEPRPIRDIFSGQAEDGRNVAIREERGKTFGLQIKRKTAKEQELETNLAEVWSSRPGSSRKESKTFGNAMNFNFIRLKGRRLGRFAIWLGAIAVALALLIIYSTSGRAEVLITAQQQDFNSELKVTASTETSTINVELNRIPGQFFSQTKEETGTFAATGSKEVVQKARGQIIIYNKSLTDQRLVATTRFESPTGLIFRIPQTVTVPAGTKSGASVTPGSVESIVYADRPGPEYNIKPANFAIPGFKGTPKLNDFFAVSKNQMAGGIIGLSAVITEEDFTKAQEELSRKIKTNIIKSLESQAAGLKVIDSVEVKIDQPATNAKSGDAAENLEMKLTGSAKIIAFRESDVRELIESYLDKKAGWRPDAERLIVSYQNPALNSSGKTMTLTARFSGRASAKIDTAKIAGEILGLDESAIRLYFKNLKEAESTKVVLSPFWVKKIPKDLTKLKITVLKR